MTNFNINTEQYEAAIRLAQKLQREADPTLPISTNMANVLLMRTSGLRAHIVTEQIRDGIASFKQLHTGAESLELSDVVSVSLDKAMAHMDEHAQRVFLCKTLAEFAAKTGVVIPNLDTANLKMLKAGVCGYLSNYSLVHMFSSAEWAAEALGKKHLRSLASAASSIQDAEYLALAMYLLQTRGEANRIPCSITPRDLGVIAAAATASAKEILRAAAENIDWDMVINVLTVIGLIAILVVAGWDMVPAVYNTALAHLPKALDAIGLVGDILAPTLSVACGGFIAAGFVKMGEMVVTNYNMVDNVRALWQQLVDYVHTVLSPASHAALAKLCVEVAADEVAEFADESTNVAGVSTTSADESAETAPCTCTEQLQEATETAFA